MKKEPDRHGGFRQRVSLAAVQVAGLSPGELSTALAYEVEPFSGVPPAEAEVVYEEVAGGDADTLVFDVTVRRRGRRAGAGWRWPVVLTAVALAAAACDCAALSWRIGSVSRKVAEQEPLDGRVRRALGAAKENSAEAARIRAGRERVSAAHDRVDRLRAAYPSLMAAVAGVCGGRMVVREFSSAPQFSVGLRAVAAPAGSSGELMSGLTRAAGEAGWSVSPGGISAGGPGSTASLDCRLEFRAAAGEVR